MVKCQIIKMEFTSGYSNDFDVSTKIYGSHIECGAKAAGKIGDDYFSAKYRFNIDEQTLTICSIYFTDITHIEKNQNSQYKISTFDSSCDFDIIDTFEQKVYNALYYILTSAVITKAGSSLIVTLTNSTTTTTIEHLVLHIKVGTHSYSNSSSACDENSTSGIIKKSHSSSSCKKNSSNNSLTKNTSKISKTKKTHKKKYKKSAMQKILKLIAWGFLISFIMYVFKSSRM